MTPEPEQLKRSRARTQARRIEARRLAPRCTNTVQGYPDKGKGRKRILAARTCGEPTLQNEVERSRRYGNQVSLIFLDLDGFKNVNDQHGHLAGSRALVEVGEVLRRTVRAIDVVSRFGGDEFTVILPQTGVQGATTIAERIRARIQEAVFLQDVGLEVRITASLGVATFPTHGKNKDDLIGQADRAMYLVKAKNKNAVEVAA